MHMQVLLRPELFSLRVWYYSDISVDQSPPPKKKMREKEFPIVGSNQDGPETMAMQKSTACQQELINHTCGTSPIAEILARDHFCHIYVGAHLSSN